MQSPVRKGHVHGLERHRDPFRGYSKRHVLRGFGKARQGPLRHSLRHAFDLRVRCDRDRSHCARRCPFASLVQPPNLIGDDPAPEGCEVGWCSFGCGDAARLKIAGSCLERIRLVVGPEAGCGAAIALTS
jgi:hypothetical protein